MGKTDFIIEPGRHDIVMSREFNAPRDVVFKACTDPDLFVKWQGPDTETVVIDKWDPRPGGSYRWVSRDPEGNEYGFRGVFHDVSPERIIQTFEFEGMPGHVCLETLTLEETNGKTKFVSVSVFQSIEDRDGMAASGMEEGATQGLERLAGLVE